MPLFLLNLLSKFWKQIIIIVFIISTGIFVYNYIYQRGVAATTEIYEEKLKEQELVLAERINAIEQSSEKLIEQSQINSDNTKKDLDKILAASKNKPLVIYKDGECNPSQTFLDSWNQINLRGNQK